MSFEERITQAFRAYLKRKGFGDYPCLTFAYAEQGLEFPVNPGQTLVLSTPEKIEVYCHSYYLNGIGQGSRTFNP